MVVDRFGYAREIFYSPWMLGLFMAILIPLSFTSHRFFEVPVQRALRSRFRVWKERKPDMTSA
jgi:peptidoglycan/LPS O-acetylase OafA/YrhL